MRTIYVLSKVRVYLFKRYVCSIRDMDIFKISNYQTKQIKVEEETIASPIVRFFASSNLILSIMKQISVYNSVCNNVLRTSLLWFVWEFCSFKDKFRNLVLIRASSVMRCTSYKVYQIFITRFFFYFTDTSIFVAINVNCTVTKNQRFTLYVI